MLLALHLAIYLKTPLTVKTGRKHLYELGIQHMEILDKHLV